MMRYLFINIIILLYLFFNICSISCLKTNFQCTKSTPSNINNDYQTSNELQSSSSSSSESKTLTLDCKNDLIYIVWSHYGHESSISNLKNKSSCNFSVNDCIVNVDYVANECNGLNNCQISLDTQYLHSCKSYSDYIFILYDCIDASKTVDICNTDVNIETNNELYIQAPNYPNEYSNNLNCNCMLDTTGSQINFQLLEFDLESSYDSEISLFSNNIISKMDENSNSNNNKCNKDYLSFDDSRYCGTIASYTNFYTNRNEKEINALSLKFTSDDSLTRRGFWIKVKGTKFLTNCPDGFFQVDSKCIKVYDSLLTWFESKKFCTNLGYELVTVDDFEINKQLNRLLDDEIKFWLGLKHLNGTHWFNENNDVVNVDTSQESWWPWLQFDSLLYKQGSCVAKHKNGLLLEDCYQRLKFACQYRLKESNEPQRISLKCGKSYEKRKLILNNNGVINQNKKSTNNNNKLSTSSSTILKKLNENKDNKILIKSNYQEITDTTTNIIISNDSNLVNNSTLVERVYITNSKFYPDSTLFITLISSVVVLIAFINFIVILILCRRRKLHHKQAEHQHHHDSHQHEYNITGHARQQHIAKFCPISSSLNSGSGGDHVSYATTTESDFLTFNTLKQQQQLQQKYPQLYFNNPAASTTSTASSIIDRSDIMVRTLQNENPSVHVYETISVYGNKNGAVSSEYQQTKLTEADFYNNNNNNSNLIIFQNQPQEDETEILSRRLSLKCGGGDRSFKQQQGKFQTFYNNNNNNFDENRFITRNSNFLNEQQLQQPLDYFNRTQSRIKLHSNLFNPTEAVV